MQPEEILDIWAPPGGAWSLWAKPVLFAQMDLSRAAVPAVRPEDLMDASWAPPSDGHTFIVIDLPGADSVYAGLALARHGYRPVPLFNACTAERELVDQSRIQQALADGAAPLRALNLPADAPPAFLLDALRAVSSRRAVPGDFDNRWCVYRDDFPSVELLRGRGLSRMVLVHRGRPPVAGDLWLALWDWQQAGIELRTKDPTPLQPLTVPAPSWLRRSWERVLTALGLRRGPAPASAIASRRRRTGERPHAAAGSP